MKRATFVAGAVCLSTIYGQVTITSADVIGIGEYFTTGVDTVLAGGPYSPGPAGPNQTWIFTGLTPSYTDSVYATSVPPQYQSLFPNANMMLVTKMLDSVFAKKTNSIFEYHGIATTVPNFGRAVFPYVNPLVGLIFPFTYPDNFTDTAIIYLQTPYSGYPGVDSVRIKSVILRWVVVDAYGVLQTPAGTFPNTIRIREKSIKKDSVWVHLTFPSPGWQLVNTSVNTSYNFSWGTNGYKYYLLSMTLASDSVTVQSIEWLTSVITSAPQYEILPTFQMTPEYKYVDLTGRVLYDKPRHKQGIFIDLTRGQKIVVVE